MSVVAKTLTEKHLKILSEPFDEKTLGVRAITPAQAGKTAILLALYIQHTDCYSRIEKVDPAWSSTITGVQMAAKSCYVWVELTILGVTRSNMGEGEDLKSATSDAIKRAAMLFGVARYLHDSEPVWVDYNDSQDRYRAWTYSDYKSGLKRGQPPVPIGPSTDPTPAAAPQIRTKEDIETEIFDLAKSMNLSDQELFSWSEEFTGKDLDRITVADLEKFLGHLQGEAARNGSPKRETSRRGFGR